MFSSLALLFGLSAAQAAPFSTSNWAGLFADGSGVLQSLVPAADGTFDFIPSDYFRFRNESGNYHTGDFTFLWRETGQDVWTHADTASDRSRSPLVFEDGSSLLSSEFSTVFGKTADHLKITRRWKEFNGDLLLEVTLQNVGENTLELGSFGFPIEINNIFTNRTADDVTTKCALADPYIGRDAGYVQITRLTGTGPNMVITPGNSRTKLEAWRFLQESADQPTSYQQVVYEGNYEFQVLTKSFAEESWKSVTPWNPPTSETLSPSQNVTFAVRFTASPGPPSNIERTVASVGIPVAVGVPGYVLPQDIDGKLFINTSEAIQSIATDPPGALQVTEKLSLNTSWKEYDISAPTSAFGRVRMDVVYQSGLHQTIHYNVVKSVSDTFKGLGSFLTDKQWYSDTSDSFKRAPSVISYDYESSDYVLQDQRAWIGGLSDEGGAGSFIAAGMKSLASPDASEIAKLEEMVNSTIWGSLQSSSGADQYSVKKSLFFFDPAAMPGFPYNPSIDFGGTWNKNEAYATWRAYDYVHVSLLYYTLYRAERASPGILKVQSAQWYLKQAYQTVRFCFAKDAEGQPVTAYGDVGLMEETIWYELLLDLEAEGLTSSADTMREQMRSRQALWASQSDPFGSEMPWDSTGQEGVYIWSKYFNDTETMTKTLSSIRAYMPTVAHWGWNGNARRYWDFLYAGKLARVERMLHHYGSGLNSLPILNAYKYRSDPASDEGLYDLRIGYGGHMGPLSNINADGFGHMAFHSWPETLKWDSYSGDYGPNFAGHVMGACSFVVEHPTFGWLTFGGNAQVDASGVQVIPKDALRRSIYVAALGLRVQFDSGAIASYTLSVDKNALVINIEAAFGATSAIMVYEDTLKKGVRLTTAGLAKKLNGLSVSLPSVVSFSL